MSRTEPSSNESLPESMDGLSLNGADKPAMTKAELVAEMDVLLVAKNYDGANKLLPSLPNKERRQYKAKIAQLKHLEDEQEVEPDEHDTVSVFHEAVSNPRKPISGHPEFVGPVEKRWISDLKGFGVVATRDVKPGELLIASKALSVGFFTLKASDFTTAKEEQEFVDSTVKIIDSDHRYAQESVPPAVDRNRVVAVLRYNAFGFSLRKQFASDDPAYSGRALWVLPSFINHSCAPNCTWLGLGDFMFVRAQKKISQGEELTLSYSNPDWNFEKRQARLSSNYGIECVCPLCECDKENLRKNPRLAVEREMCFADIGRTLGSLMFRGANPQSDPSLKKSLAKFEPLIYKNRYDAGLGFLPYWSARSLKQGWTALAGNDSGNKSFVAAPVADLINYAVLSLSYAHCEGKAMGPEAVEWANIVLKYAKIEYGAPQALEMLSLMFPDNDTQTAVDLTKQLLQMS